MDRVAAPVQCGYFSKVSLERAACLDGRGRANRGGMFSAGLECLGQGFVAFGGLHLFDSVLQGVDLSAEGG